VRVIWFFYDGVKGFVGKDGVVVNQTVTGYVSLAHVKPINCV